MIAFRSQKRTIRFAQVIPALLVRMELSGEPSAARWRDVPFMADVVFEFDQGEAVLSARDQSSDRLWSQQICRGSLWISAGVPRDRSIA
jgi:hypothetical protein